MVGEILSGWNIIASYAHTDAKVTEDTEGEDSVAGNRFPNVPKNAFSLWKTYEIQQGNLQGLGFGLGLFLVGDRPGNLANSFELPSYFRTDASVFYRKNNWRAALNFKNLFDIDYLESSAEFRQLVNPGIPFTVIGSLSVEF